MIPRLKGVITHDHDTKLPVEDGEDSATGSGTRPNPKMKSFEENPIDIPTGGWGNRPNPGKDHTPTCGWGNKPNPKNESHVRQHRRRTRPEKVYTYPVVGEDHTSGCRDRTHGYSDGRMSATNKG